MEPTGASWGKGKDEEELLTPEGRGSGGIPGALRHAANADTANPLTAEAELRLSDREHPVITVYSSREYRKGAVGTEIHCEGAQ